MRIQRSQAGEGPSTMTSLLQAGCGLIPQCLFPGSKCITYLQAIILWPVLVFCLKTSRLDLIKVKIITFTSENTLLIVTFSYWAHLPITQTKILLAFRIILKSHKELLYKSHKTVVLTM